ncbi:MAG: hypothetical protein RBU37_20435, partial [Myxococcota bacterium]|nr:hypothetical protein [Myxococcota bacterium]
MARLEEVGETGQVVAASEAAVSAATSLWCAAFGLGEDPGTAEMPVEGSYDSCSLPALDYEL